MKYLAIIAVAVLGLSFGACANKDHSASHSASTTQSTSTGYSK
jgi:hypothetical protein